MVQQSFTEEALSRRGFLSGSGRLLGGGALALALGGGSLLPKTADAANTAGDIAVLNYALTLEHLEYAFYREGLKRFTTQDFRLAFLRYRRYQKAGIRILDGAEVRKYFELIREHEHDHVKTLTAVIRQLGGKPVPECRYRFPYKNVKGFVQLARIFENLGVSAYDGAIHKIKNPDLLTAGATIATVEARHASYLNLINGYVPFPASFDKPKSKQQVLKAASPFIASCPR